MGHYCTPAELKLFSKFLKHHEIEVEFEKEVKIRTIMEIQSAKELVANAFTWSNADRKFAFWNTIDESWRIYLKQNQRKNAKRS